jgi:hypothetical protein
MILINKAVNLKESGDILMSNTLGCQEVRELQRQLDHSLKLEEFLRTKGTVRLTAADAKAETKRLEQQEEEMRTYNNYVSILDSIRVS